METGCLSFLATALVALCVISFQACSDKDDDKENTIPIEINLSEFSVGECEGNKAISADEEKIVISPISATGEVTIEHQNATLNCVSNVTINVVFSADNKTITVDETEEEPLADCECIKDIIIKLNDVVKGNYTLVIPRIGFKKEISISDKVIEFSVEQD